jgi:hypothetical protein
MPESEISRVKNKVRKELISLSAELRKGDGHAPQLKNLASGIARLPRRIQSRGQDAGQVGGARVPPEENQSDNNLGPTPDALPHVTVGTFVIIASTAIFDHTDNFV